MGSENDAFHAHSKSGLPFQHLCEPQAMVLASDLLDNPDRVNYLQLLSHNSPAQYPQQQNLILPAYGICPRNGTELNNWHQLAPQH